MKLGLGDRLGLFGNGGAVKIVRDIDTFSSKREATAFCNSLPSDTAVEKIEVASGVSKVYLCPTQVSHRGDPNKCDNSCANTEALEV